MNLVELTSLANHCVPLITLNRSENVILGGPFGSIDLFIEEIINVSVETFSSTLVDYQLRAGYWYLILCPVNLPDDSFDHSEVRSDLWKHHGYIRALVSQHRRIIPGCLRALIFSLFFMRSYNN